MSIKALADTARYLAGRMIRTGWIYISWFFAGLWDWRERSRWGGCLPLAAVCAYFTLMPYLMYQGLRGLIGVLAVWWQSELIRLVIMIQPLVFLVWLVIYWRQKLMRAGRRKS